MLSQTMELFSRRRYTIGLTQQSNNYGIMPFYFSGLRSPLEHGVDLGRQLRHPLHLRPDGQRLLRLPHPRPLVPLHVRLVR